MGIVGVGLGLALADLVRGRDASWRIILPAGFLMPIVSSSSVGRLTSLSTTFLCHSHPSVLYTGLSVKLESNR